MQQENLLNNSKPIYCLKYLNDKRPTEKFQSWDLTIITN